MFIAVYWLYYAFLTTYSWYVQHVLPKKEICCFLFYAEVHTQEKLHWSSCTFISHVDLYLHRSDKNNTKNHSPFLNCTVKAKNKCYLLKCYTFRCFGNAHKLYSYVTERQIFNIFWHKTSKLTIQKLSSLVFYADGLQHAFQLWDNLHLASQSEHNNIH